MEATKTVGLVGGAGADEAIAVLTAVARSCGLSLRRAHSDESGGFAGLILLGKTGEQSVMQIAADRPSIRLISSDAPETLAMVRFGAGTNSPMPFRGRSLFTRSAVPTESRGMSGEVIATADGRPVWTTSSEGNNRHDTCWVPRPWIKPGDCVFDHLKGNRLMSLLPLVEWLREISGWREWSHPPFQACFMFDDPNLHATRYGFVNFKQLAAEGRRNRYHVASATVPLDGYYVNGAAARIIRENPQTLSLLVHGNNHTKRELAGPQTPGEQLALAHQAVLRSDRLARKARVPVSRVMAPPHGVCSAGMMSAMAVAGFEAVCASHGAVWTANPRTDWTVALGTSPATVVAGLPVIPRFTFDRKLENKALLAAYLHQPIIPQGHHGDLADGIDILTWAADFINGLGPVAWSDMKTIARNNYRYRIQDHLLRVQMFSRALTIAIPKGVSEVAVEAPWLDSSETIRCRTAGQAAGPSGLAQTAEMHFPVPAGSIVELAVVRLPANGNQSYAFSRTPLRAVARRVLGEMRDRSMPFRPRKRVTRSTPLHARTAFLAL